MLLAYLVSAGGLCVSSLLLATLLIWSSRALSLSLFLFRAPWGLSLRAKSERASRQLQFLRQAEDELERLHNLIAGQNQRAVPAATHPTCYMTSSTQRFEKAARHEEMPSRSSIASHGCASAEHGLGTICHSSSSRLDIQP